jgi:hypothetical protein
MIVARMAACEAWVIDTWAKWFTRAKALDARVRDLWVDAKALAVELKGEWKDGLFWFTWYQVLRICATTRDLWWPEYRKMMEDAQEDAEDWQNFLDEYGITRFEDIWRA